MVKFTPVTKGHWQEPKQPWIKNNEYSRTVNQVGHTYQLVKFERAPSYLECCLCALKALWLIISTCGKAFSGKKVTKFWDQARGRKNISCRFGEEIVKPSGKPPSKPPASTASPAIPKLKPIPDAASTPSVPLEREPEVNADPHAMTLKQLSEENIDTPNLWLELDQMTKDVIGADHLPPNPGYERSEAEKQMKYNRYPAYLPYDRNTVKTAKGEYLNCSKVEMHGVVRFLAQGPLSTAEKGGTGTVETFLTVVREQKVKIVCLTEAMEKGKVKCANYWASGQKYQLVDGYQCLGEKKSTILAEKNGRQIIERELKVIDSRGKECDPIIMMHYVGWDDFTPPDTDLIKAMHKHIRGNEGYLVHCSAGIGRTGTWFAIEMLCKDIEDQLQKGVPLDDVKINILQTILELRKQRYGSVYTHDQFKSIFAYVIHYYQQRKQEAQ